MSSRHAELRAAIRRSVPRRPGVYIFRGASGLPVYIGKSVDLRQRMLSHLSPGSGQFEGRSGLMVSSIRDFEFRETPTELLALLLEDALIKRESPTYNRRQQANVQHRYLVLTDDPYPACRIVDHPDDARGTLFGPFRGPRFAEDLLAIINRHFRVRSCTEATPIRMSANFGLGRCAGPCRGKISVREYAEIADRVRALLGGHDGWIDGELQREMAELASALEYEKAEALRGDLEFLRSFCSRQRFARRFATERLTIREHGTDFAYAYDFERGVLTRAAPGGDPPTRPMTIPVELRQGPTGERELADRAGVVSGWLRRHRRACEFAFAAIPQSNGGGLLLGAADGGDRCGVRRPTTGARFVRAIAALRPGRTGNKTSPGPLLPRSGDDSL